MRFVGLVGVTGLILDIMGAWYITRGLVKKNLNDIRHEAPQFTFGINEAYVIGALTQRIEARIGFVLLFWGFGLQAITYVLSTELSSMSILQWWLSADLFSLIMIFVLSDYAIKRTVRTTKKNFLREQIKKYIKSTENAKHLEDTKRYLRYLSVKFDEGISSEEAWHMLLLNLGINQLPLSE